MIAVTPGGAGARAARLALAAARIARRFRPAASLAGAREQAGARGSLARARRRFASGGDRAEALAAEIVQELEA
ncbi:MAG TPA: hypothetical protein VFA22_08295 [Stellaceae bacterium]|nr:hypothetical protein [Stellaceae bacterium]